ncbi:MAG: 4-hydroxy-3-methylbut-2-enyl diphosphate reductase [Lentisphaeria bacterium]|nr:4-hydroxy-3-methylbut-2-enyl diphosphate reductase [Lentisphaeria bacterium]
MEQKKRLFIAQPHGVCAGVERAIDTVEEVLKTANGTVWVLHELVHNDFLTEELTRRGVRFTENINDVPDGSVLLFGAHGVGNDVEELARRKKLQITDATCPLVCKLQKAACDAVKNGEKVILFGHKNHPEVCGVLGRLPEETVFPVSSPAEVSALPDLNGTPCRMLSQTTMNTQEIGEVFSAVQKRFPHALPGTGACYATTQRQNAVRKLAEKVDFIVILGSVRSSNSRRLQEIAAACGAESLLLDSAAELPPELLKNRTAVGLSSGASVPEQLFTECVRKLEESGFNEKVIVSGE